MSSAMYKLASKTTFLRPFGESTGHGDASTVIVDIKI